MARPEKVLDPMQKAEVETLAAVLTAAQVADYFGIGRTTFFAMMERDPEIAERYKRGKAKAIGVIAQGLINKARSGDTASMIFFLKTQAGWRETAKVEHVVPEQSEEEGPGAVERLQSFLDMIARRHNVAGTLIGRPLADGGLELSVENGVASEAESPP